MDIGCTDVSVRRRRPQKAGRNMLKIHVRDEEEKEEGECVMVNNVIEIKFYSFKYFTRK